MVSFLGGGKPGAVAAVLMVLAAGCAGPGTGRGHGARTLAERRNGVRWAVQHAPGIGQIGYSALTAVSCASAADCTAVGSYNHGAFGIAEHWDGSRWAIRRLPAPPGPADEPPLVLPVSVSCTPAGCMAVGTSQNRTLAERWDGSRWIIERTPNPA